MTHPLLSLFVSTPMAQAQIQAVVLAQAQVQGMVLAQTMVMAHAQVQRMVLAQAQVQGTVQAQPQIQAVMMMTRPTGAGTFRLMRPGTTPPAPLPDSAGPVRRAGPARETPPTPFGCNLRGPAWRGALAAVVRHPYPT